MSDIQAEVVPIELTLKSQFVQKTLSDDEQEDIYMLDFIQRWFFDGDYNEDFRFLISSLNSKISTNNFEFNLDEVVSENLVQIFTVEQKDLLDKRILMSAYLKYLSGNKEDAQLLYSLYFEEKKKLQLSENIIRKSIYEYYVLLKFKYKEEHKMTNIFALRNKPKNFELTSKQIDLMISVIEKLWVDNG